ncbi:MAG: PEGA domain-containing protein [Myxococcales bacterium]|nr:PEGA domain-containing protein [Myxococcales bacterium]
MAGDSSPRWLLVMATGSPQAREDAVGATRSLEDTMTAIGFPVYTGREATSWFENNFSRPMFQMDDKQRHTLQQCWDGALNYIVDGQAKRTQQTVEACLNPLDTLLDGTNRRDEDAARIFDICLLEVRALHYDGKIDEAYRYALKCRRLVPDARPSTHLHPPEVVSLIMKADSDLHAQKHGTLSINSTESNCAVFLNGRRYGQTPFQSGPLPGGSYWTQLECPVSGASRVHRVHLGADSLRVVIDSVFDRAFSTDDGELGLHYATPGIMSTRLTADLHKLADAANASEVFVVAPLGERRVRIDRFVPARNQIVASVWLRLTPKGDGFAWDAASTAINELISERSVDLSSARPIEAKPWHPASLDMPSEVEKNDDIGPIWLGAGLAGLGVAGLGTGWILRQHYVDASGEGGTRGWHWLFGGLGALSLSASWHFWLPAQPGVPWWAWLAGGIGLTGAALGTIAALVPSECTVRGTQSGQCFHEKINSGLGDMVLLTSLPLVGIPVTYLLREVMGDSSQVAASTQVSAHGFSFGFLMRN